MSRVRIWVLLLIGLAGCAPYRASPLEPNAVLAELRAVVPEGAGTRFEPVDGLSEDEAVALALVLNPDLRERRAERGIAEAQLLAAGLYPNPELDLTWISLGGGTLLEGGLLQALFQDGGRGLRREKAKLRIEEVDLEQAAAEWKLAQEVRSAFVDRLAAEEMLQDAQGNLELRTGVVALAEARRELGATTALESDLAGLEASRQRQALLQAERRQIHARQILNALLGLGPGISYPLQASPQPGAAPVIARGIEGLEELAVAKRPDLAAARTAYEQSERDLQLATRGGYPRLRMGPAYHREESDDGIGMAAAVEIPLWNRNQGEIAEKLAARRQSAEAFRAQVARIRVDLATALADLEREWALLQVLEEEILPRLDRMAVLMGEGVKAGKTDAESWMLAQGRLIEARRERREARASCRKALIRLETVVGCPLPGAQEASRP